MGLEVEAVLGGYPHHQGCVDTPPLQNEPPQPAHLLAAGIVTELVIAGVQRLPSINRIQDHLVPDDHLWGTGGAE
jgi:hypothetical protein